MMLDETTTRGALIASRAILSAILVEIGGTHGYEAVRRIRARADAHVTAAAHRMNRASETPDEIGDAKESWSAADGFLDAAFEAAYASE